jgi:hypothetical protein
MARHGGCRGTRPLALAAVSAGIQLELGRLRTSLEARDWSRHFDAASQQTGQGGNEGEEQQAQSGRRGKEERLLRVDGHVVNQHGHEQDESIGSSHGQMVPRVVASDGCARWTLGRQARRAGSSSADPPHLELFCLQAILRCRRNSNIFTLPYTSFCTMAGRSTKKGTSAAPVSIYSHSHPQAPLVRRKTTSPAPAP